MDSKQLEKRKKVLLDLMNDKIYVPMKIKELAIILQVSKEERPDLELVLNELLAEGKIEISKRGKYKIAKEKTVTGTFVTHPKGFGFIEVEGRDDDIYVSEENIGNAFYGDVVQATLISGTTGRRQEGRITQVISHTVKEVVGSLLGVFQTHALALCDGCLRPNQIRRFDVCQIIVGIGASVAVERVDEHASEIVVVRV